MDGGRAGPRARGLRLLAAGVGFGFVVGSASGRATPAPGTSLPPLPPIVVTVTTTPSTVVTTVAQPVTSPPALVDVYGLPLDTALTFAVPLPPPTTGPDRPPPTSTPPVENTAPPTTNCPRKKHHRRCKP